MTLAMVANAHIDEVACAKIMRRYKLASQEEAINLVLRKVAAEPSPFILPANAMSLEEALTMQGTGWDRIWTLCVPPVTIAPVDPYHQSGEILWQTSAPT